MVEKLQENEYIYTFVVPKDETETEFWNVVCEVDCETSPVWVIIGWKCGDWGKGTIMIPSVFVKGSIATCVYLDLVDAVWEAREEYLCTL